MLLLNCLFRFDSSGSAHEDGGCYIGNNEHFAFELGRQLKFSPNIAIAFFFTTHQQPMSELSHEFALVIHTCFMHANVNVFCMDSQLDQNNSKHSSLVTFQVVIQSKSNHWLVLESPYFLFIECMHAQMSHNI